MSHRWMSAAPAALVLFAGPAVRPQDSLLATVPGSLAIAAVVLLGTEWLTGRRTHAPMTAARAAGAAGAASIVATTGTLVHPYAAGSANAPGVWGMVEVLALLVLHATAVRWAPRRPAIVGASVSGAALAVWVLRFIPDLGVLEGLAACTFWAGAAVVVTVVSGYPRLAEERGAREVAEARRRQRLDLAADLHDFVAHDVSGIVVQAQAAAFVAQSDPQQALVALRRIEEAGLQALRAMDRTVAMLRDDDEPHGPHASPLTLDDVPGLVARFGEAGDARVRLDMDADLGLAVPREQGAVIYRILVEALTNVRRHAGSPHRVDITIRWDDGTVTATVVNDVSPSPGAPDDRRGGFGLIGLSELVAALGGTLLAGRCPEGWQVRAALPLEAAP